MDTVSPKTWAQIIRPFYRRPALVILATAAVGCATGFQYKAAKYRKNEAAQKDGLSVSVDRSGGGV